MYEVFFEINGKKMKTKVYAKDVFEAMTAVKRKMGTNQIKFYKTVKIDDVVADLMNIFGMKK